MPIGLQLIVMFAPVGDRGNPVIPVSMYITNGDVLSVPVSMYTIMAETTAPVTNGKTTVAPPNTPSLNVLLVTVCGVPTDPADADDQY